jgi:PAS domain-containing protein
MPIANCCAAELDHSIAPADLLAALDWRRRLAAEMAAAVDADTVVVAEQSSHARGPEAVATIVAAGPGAATLIAALSGANADGVGLTDHGAGAIALRLPPAEDGAGRRAAVAATSAGKDRLLWLAASRPRPAPDDLATRLRQAVVWLPSLIAIGRPLDHLLAEWEALSDLLRRLPQPVLIADANGFLQRTNRAADALLSHRDGLVLRDGRLRALCRDEDGALVEAIGADGSRAAGVRELVLSRPTLGGGRRCGCVVRPRPATRRRRRRA